MFTKLELNNFKSLGRFDRPLGALTLLTGLNAAGKSSVIQSLALLRQTVTDREWSKALQLNGSSVQLGTMFDVIDRNSGGAGFRIAVSSDRWMCEWETTSKDRKRDLVAPLSGIQISIDGVKSAWGEADLEHLAVRRLIPESLSETNSAIFDEMQVSFASICHVGAERIGPREVYVAHTPLVFPDVGAFGEKTPWCLEQFADSGINPSLALPGVPEFVRHTVQAWMSQLFPGFGLELKRVDAANLLTMGIRTTPQGDYFRPMNVGFGLTHVLPIFTACIAALPGRLVIVENPETHLHPAGQSLIGYFLALSAAAGVQVLVETHSDHVLNGVRRAIRDKRLASDATQIYFFKGDVDEGEAMQAAIESVGVDQKGRLTGWPAGFFDQLEADLDYIFRE